MDSLVKSVLSGIEERNIKTVVCFKSRHEYFCKEKIGVKPNTQREPDEMDDRFDILKKGMADFIEVKDADTGETFIREITDVSIYNNWMTISWKHPK